MSRKKKIIRAFFFAAVIYIIINIFVFGLMTAYINTNNIVSSEKLVMAEVNSKNDKTNIEILGKDLTFENDPDAQMISAAAAYTVMPQSFRICTQIAYMFYDIADGFLKDL